MAVYTIKLNNNNNKYLLASVISWKTLTIKIIRLGASVRITLQNKTTLTVLFPQVLSYFLLFLFMVEFLFACKNGICTYQRLTDPSRPRDKLRSHNMVLTNSLLSKLQPFALVKNRVSHNDHFQQEEISLFELQFSVTIFCERSLDKFLS